MTYAEMPVIESGKSIIDTLVASSIADSEGAARRLVSGGGCKVEWWKNR